LTARLIRACASLFIGSGKFVFYLCAAIGSVIFDSRDSRSVIMPGHGWTRVPAPSR
jgi:hypothetical protein